MVQNVLYVDLANQCLKPLSHFSRERGINCVYRKGENCAIRFLPIVNK